MRIPEKPPSNSKGDLIHGLRSYPKKKEKTIILTMSKRLKRSRLELENLPDEMLLKIFSYMNMQELLQYSQVSKRIRAICSDKSF